MPRSQACLLSLVLTVLSAAAGEPFGGAQGREPVERPAKFTQPPKAERDGEAVKVSFAVSAETDVAVWIENAEGRVVRHLAAGLLGAKAPAPLAAGKLEQSLVWDRKDDAGKPVPEGKYQVKVGAGLAPSWAGMMFEDKPGPDSLCNVMGLAAAPDGRVYVLSSRWNMIWWSTTTIHVFGRSGAYEKTVKPFPSDVPPGRLAGVSAIKGPDGRTLPVIHRVLAMTFYGYEDFAQQMAVTPEGNLHLVTVPTGYEKPSVQRLASIAPDGGLPYDEYVGGLLLDRAGVGQLSLAPASDGKSVYLIGLCPSTSSFNVSIANPPTVYRVELPERKVGQAFFGQVGVAGSDEKSLKDPQGLATDGQGRLFVADRGNDRVVVVDEKTGAFAGSLAVKAPSWVGVHRKSGAVYVQSGGEVVKLSGWKEPKELARLQLPAAPMRDKRPERMYLALDPEADPAVLWIGRSSGAPALSRCEEKDGKFAAPEPAGFRPAKMFWNVAVSPDRELVACKTGSSTLTILEEPSGKTRSLQPGGSSGTTYRLGPNGQIYGLDHWGGEGGGGVMRWDASGKSLPFPETLADPKLKGRLANGPSGTTAWERDFCVDREGNVYTKHRGKHYHGRMRVDVYGADGKFKRTAIWVVSDGGIGPRLDPAGNIYIADSVKPVGQPFPDDFKGELPGMRVQQQYTWIYGSVIKFAPVGGAIWFPITAREDEYSFDGEAKLPADQPKEKFGAIRDGLMLKQTGELQGALWWRYGCSYLLDMHVSHNVRCHCTAVEFDVDGFGRTFYPDQGRFKLVALDTAGNELLRFGGYGNQDSCGPESYVLDPQTKVFRPRRENDPKDLKSPFAEPDVPFAWITGLGVSDRYLYLTDGMNRRLVRVKLGYAAEATAEVP
jgi:hypothetical protein